LLGFDHIKEEEAEIMQSHEIQLITQLGFANPYDMEAL
jgi:probable rRNA maturation factor